MYHKLHCVTNFNYDGEKFLFNNKKIVSKTIFFNT